MGDIPYFLRKRYPLSCILIINIQFFFMRKNQRTNSLFKLLGSLFVIMVLSSFDIPDPCKPTDEQVRSVCEYSSTQVCIVSYTTGPCVGSSYTYMYNRSK